MLTMPDTKFSTLAIPSITAVFFSASLILNWSRNFVIFSFIFGNSSLKAIILFRIVPTKIPRFLKPIFNFSIIVSLSGINDLKNFTTALSLLPIDVAVSMNLSFILTIKPSNSLNVGMCKSTPVISL